MSDPDAEIAGIQQHRAVQQLRRHVDEFMSIEDEGLRDEELYHRALSRSLKTSMSFSASPRLRVKNIRTTQASGPHPRTVPHIAQPPTSA